jgi:phage baseplate assembly protein W
MDVAFPLDFDALGRTATADEPQHVRQMIEQVLFTAPGERVNRPHFGCGLLELVFDPNNETLSVSLRSLIEAQLLEALGDRIVLEALRVESLEERLLVTIDYQIRRTLERGRAQFERGPGHP